MYLPRFNQEIKCFRSLQWALLKTALLQFLEILGRKSSKNIYTSWNEMNGKEFLSRAPLGDTLDMTDYSWLLW